MAPTTKWIKLQHVCASTCDRDLKHLNTNEFVCTNYFQQPFDAIENDDGYLHRLDIHKYNLASNQWTQISYNINKPYHYSLKLTIDEDNQCFYIYTTDGKLYIIKSTSNTMHLILDNLPQYHNPWQMLFIAGKIIVMAEDVTGFVIDTKNNMEITELCRSGNFQVTDYSPPLTSQYIQSQNHILSIVADPYEDDGYIHTLSLDDNRLIETDFLFPKNLGVIRTCQGYVLTKDQKYLIILGGWEVRSYGLHDDIVLFNIEHNTLSYCELRCPFQGKIEAISMSDDERDELLVSGYVRQAWELPEFKNLRPFPELMDLILQRISIEYIHVIGRGAFRDSGKNILEHWKVNVDDILNSIIVE